MPALRKQMLLRHRHPKEGMITKLSSQILVTILEVRIRRDGTLMFMLLVTLMSITIDLQTSRVVITKDQVAIFNVHLECLLWCHLNRQEHVLPLKDKMIDLVQAVKIPSIIQIGDHTIPIQVEIPPGIEVDMISLQKPATN